MANLRFSPKTVVTVAALAGVYTVLAWLANASNAAANLHRYPFNETLSFGSVFSDMAALSLTDIVAFSDVDLMMPFSNIVLFASFAAGVIGLVTQNRVAQFGAIALTVPYGLLGIIAWLPAGVDGEWLAEGWGMLATITVWMLFLGVLTSVNLRSGPGGVPVSVDAVLT